jgi:phosphohistidine phosphatase
VDDGVGPLVMRVFLVRHGEACDAIVDPARPLTDAGRDEIARLAEWCAANGVAPQKIRHSGILRAAQTAEILGARLAPSSGVRAVRGLAPDDHADVCAEELKHEPASTMLVTHMPFVGELAALLVGSRAPASFATGSIACFDREGEEFRLAATWSPGADD